MVALIANLGAAGAMAQCGQWSLGTTAGPSPRQNHAMRFDGTSLMLFGGYRAGVGLNDETWLWNGEQWTQSAATGPQARSVHKMAFNSSSGKVILFGGGLGGNDALDDTWQWDGVVQTWTELFPANKPAPRFNHAMAYDAARDRIVLFGGFGATRYADTWVFDGNDWTQLAPANSPSGRNGHAMVYDAAREVVVLFGGYPDWTNDTWEWDGINWTQRAVAGPPGRQYLGMAYDSDRGVTVLSCGQMPENGRAEDTWEYNGAEWIELDVGSPGIRTQHVLEYLPTTRQMVLHGGYAGNGNVLDDTWTLTCDCDPCDMDCSGIVNAFDIEPFLDLLFGPGEPCAPCTGDVDGNGVIDAFDIEPFLECLFP